MAKVKTFFINPDVPDKAIAEFITQCEEKHYVTVTLAHIPGPRERLTVLVTKLDEKDLEEAERPPAYNRQSPPPPKKLQQKPWDDRQK